MQANDTEEVAIRKQRLNTSVYTWETSVFSIPIFNSNNGSTASPCIAVCCKKHLKAQSVVTLKDKLKDYLGAKFVIILLNRLARLERLYLRLVAGRSSGDIAYTILPLHLATVGHFHLQA